MTKRYDAIVVGAGHNGLTTAFYLAKARLKTLVREHTLGVGSLVRPATMQHTRFHKIGNKNGTRSPVSI